MVKCMALLVIVRSLMFLTQYEEGCRGEEAAAHLPRQVGQGQQGGGGCHDGHRCPLLLQVQGACCKCGGRGVDGTARTPHMCRLGI